MQIFHPHPVELAFVSHSRITHQDDDVTEKFEGTLPPFAAGSRS